MSATPANPTSPSLTRALLGLPEFNARGVLHSIVFTALPASVQQAIKNSRDEAERIELACEAGDREPLIRQMHRDFIGMPTQRQAQGLVFPAIDNLDDSFLRTMLRDEDRSWMIREGKIQSITPELRGSSWTVRVGYTDGTVRAVSGNSVPLDEQTAKIRAEQIMQIATLFSMLA